MGLGLGAAAVLVEAPAAAATGAAGAGLAVAPAPGSLAARACAALRSAMLGMGGWGALAGLGAAALDTAGAAAAAGLAAGGAGGVLRNPPLALPNPKPPAAAPAPVVPVAPDVPAPPPKLKLKLAGAPVAVLLVLGAAAATGLLAPAAAETFVGDPVELMKATAGGWGEALRGGAAAWDAGCGGGRFTVVVRSLPLVRAASTSLAAAAARHADVEPPGVAGDPGTAVAPPVAA